MNLLILSPDAHSIFFPKTAFVFGGIEVETGYYARGLASGHGFEVTVVTRDQGRRGRRVEGVTVVPHPELKGLGYWKNRRSLSGRIQYRIFGEQTGSIDEFYTSLRPDAAYVQGMAPWTLGLARFCQRSGTPFLFRVATDMDLGGENLDAAIMRQWSGFSLAETREIIQSAACVLVQTPVQMSLLQERFNRTGTMLFNPVEPPSPPSGNHKKTYDVLWIGKSAASKRPECLLELARRLPEKSFCMVLNKADEAQWERLRVSLPANVDFIEKIPFPEIGRLYERSRVFVSTAEVEGFANTFLQAAAHGVPVVSMNCDPNFMLSKHGAGWLTGPELESLSNRVETLLGDTRMYSACSLAARHYVRTHHDARKIVSQFSEVCRGLVSSPIQLPTGDGPTADLNDTGERMIPETTRSSIFWEHIFRYAFACGRVKGRAVLDIASGEGYGTHALAQVAKSVVGVDVSSEAVAHAKKRYHLDFRVGSAESIPAENGTLDTVVSFETLEHVRDPQMLVREAFRVLKPGGQLIISTPNRVLSQLEATPNPFHCSELTRPEFKALLLPWFEIQSLYGQGFPCPELNRFQQLLGKVSNRLAFWLRTRIENFLVRRALPMRDDGGIGSRQRIIEALPNLCIPTGKRWNPYSPQILEENSVREPAYFIAMAVRRSESIGS